ncbi:kinase-like protein [Daedalea quercina L-15889]|uniref:Kinase-like protein n=1 Tax=Daedalea quercina L-15889 TaxID=1314783 RepID=A0A165RUC7_9APHY|nr:kinase-like protein [Daedalea quercina L-15889]
MGFLGETIRSIQCTGRVKERTNAPPQKAEGQTFEDHRDEYRFLAPVIQVEEPVRKPSREATLRFYKKITEDLKKRTYAKPEPFDPSSRLAVDFDELFATSCPKHAKSDASSSKRDEAQDADPAYIHKLLDWAEDKVSAPSQVAKPPEASSQPGLAGSPTLCHILLDAPILAPKVEPKTDITPSTSPEPPAYESPADYPEVKLTPPIVVALKPSDFHVLKLLGKGGQGTVLLVEHKVTGTVHALKMMAKYPEKLEDKENKAPADNNQGRDARRVEKIHKRIFEEQAIMRSLALSARETTSCFLDFEASFHDMAHYFFLTGYATRGDLWTEIERHKATGMSEGMILGYAAEIIHILTALHSFSIVHRDFKPDNILIDAQGHLLLADFGISRAFELPTDARPWVKEEPVPSLKLNAPVLVKHASGSSLVLSPPSPANARESVDSAMHHIPAAPTPANTEAPSTPGGEVRKEEQFRLQEERDAQARRERLRAEVEELNLRKLNLRKVVRAELAARHMTLNVCGTPGFVAPEVYRGPAYSYSADVWAAGVIIFKMAFGKLPFGLTKKMEMQDRVKQTCFSPLVFPDDGRRVVSPALKDLLSEMLEKDPTKRPQAGYFKIHPYFSTIDWDAIARREGSGPGINAHAAEKKTDKRIAMPKGAPYLPGEDPTPWMDWIAPTLRDKLAAHSAMARSTELHAQGESLCVASPSIPRSRSSRLLQRCKSVLKLSASQRSLNAGVEC